MYRHIWETVGSIRLPASARSDQLFGLEREILTIQVLPRILMPYSRRIRKLKSLSGFIWIHRVGGRKKIPAKFVCCPMAGRFEQVFFRKNGKKMPELP